MCQKNKVLHGIKSNQEIFTNLLKTMQQLSINLLCSSDYRATYSFCEIKHFVKQAKSLLIHFQGFWKISRVITSFLVLRVLYTILFTDLIYHLWKRRYEQFYGSGDFLDWSQPGWSWLLAIDLKPTFFHLSIADNIIAFQCSSVIYPHLLLSPSHFQNSLSTFSKEHWK